MNLELPKRLRDLAAMSHAAAENFFRPISRKYDIAEHTRPAELEMLGAALGGMNAGNRESVGTGSLRRNDDEQGVRNGASMATVIGIGELCWGDVGLALSIPGQGLGNSAIAAVADEDQRRRFAGKWAAMAITEPGAGSDSASIRTTAVLDGDDYVINGEKIFVTAGERADCVVVWATLDRSKGRAAIKSFVVEKGTPGMELVRLDKKLGIRASDTAVIRFADCRVPRRNLLGSPEIDVKKGFAGVMQTFDNTRPVVAAMGVGISRAAIERTREILREHGVRGDYTGSIWSASAAEAELYRMEADVDAAWLLTLRAAWMADNGLPNSKEASIAKAKAGRVANQVTLRCVELCAAVGYGETELLEKWARDSKILDIFEGTQQIQLLIIARRLLGKSSEELR